MYKKYDDAESFYRKAIRVAPKHADNLGNFADFMSDVRKEVNLASKLYKQAIEADPKHPYNLHNYAQFVLTTRHDYRAAEKLLRQGLEAHPNDGSCMSLLAMIMWEYYEEQPFDKVQELLEKVYMLHPKDTTNMVRLASFYEQVKGDKRKAKELTSKAERIKKREGR